MTFIKNDLIKSLFTTTEIDKINKVPRKDRSHPLRRLLLPDDRDGAVIYNTEKSIHFILRNDKNWVSSLKGRLLETEDFSTSSGALGEIRAYGYLLEANITVKTPKTKSSKPEFLIKENGETIRVEVTSKQSDKTEAISLENFLKESPRFKEGQKVAIREHVDIPFGKPTKEGETVTENEIHKIAQIKQDEKQFDQEQTSILWLDFQDECWQLYSPEHAIPISTHNGEFYSGGIWYAFYGWKGAPIFEHKTTEERAISTINRMKHYGRFFQITKIDAAIISFPRATLIVENPFTRKSVPHSLWRKLVQLPRFAYEYSYIDWPGKNLKKRLKLDIETIKYLEREAKYSW